MFKESIKKIVTLSVVLSVFFVGAISLAGEEDNIPTTTDTTSEVVATRWVDEEMNDLKTMVGSNEEAGTIEGYEFVSTSLLNNGRLQIHRFKKVTEDKTDEAPKDVATRWIDEETGEDLKPMGSNGEAGEIEGYEFVKTVVMNNGGLQIHHFKKVTDNKTDTTSEVVATRWVDEDMNDLKPMGNNEEAGTIEGYEFVSTSLLNNGRLQIHRFKKVISTPTLEAKPVSRTQESTATRTVPNTAVK